MRVEIRHGVGHSVTREPNVIFVNESACRLFKSITFIDWTDETFNYTSRRQGFSILQLSVNTDPFNVSEVLAGSSNPRLYGANKHHTQTLMRYRQIIGQKKNNQRLLRLSTQHQQTTTF